LLITIITVVYNGANTIGETLQSVCAQTYPDIEHIVIDGASSDQTLSIVRTFPHVKKIVSETDNGPYDAMNKGIALAKGALIGILNADDVYANNKVIEKVAHLFQQDDSLDLLYGNIEYFDTKQPGKILRYWQTKPYYETFFEDGEVPPHPSLFVKKAVYQTIGKYNPTFKISGDYDFMFRALKIHNYKSYFLAETMVKMRLGGISTSGVKSYWISTKELMKVWRINGFTYPPKLLVLRPIKKIWQYYIA